jgi:TolA-binding protein
MPEDPQEPNPQTPTPPADPNGGTSPERTLNQEQVDRIVQDRLARERTKYGMTPEEVQALKTKAEQLEAQGLSEQERIQRERDEARQRAQTLEPENMRLRVALEKGLVGDRSWVVDRLRGNSVEELLADADSILTRLTPAPAAPAAVPPAAPASGAPAIPPSDGGAAAPVSPSDDEAVAAYVKHHFGVEPQ